LPFNSKLAPSQIQIELFTLKPVLQVVQVFMSDKQSPQFFTKQALHLNVPELKKNPVKQVSQSVKEEQVLQGPTQFIHSLVELFS
jgi:hypothetical protein